MKWPDDIKELIHGQAATPAEIAELEGVAAAVELELAAPVRPRPGFRPELRARLMEQARRELAVPAPAEAVAPAPPSALPPRRLHMARPDRSFQWMAGWGVAVAAAAVAVLVLWPRSQALPTPAVPAPAPAPALAPAPAVGATAVHGSAAPADLPARPPLLPYRGAPDRAHSAYLVEGKTLTLPEPVLEVAGAGVQVPPEVLVQTSPATVVWHPTRSLALAASMPVYQLVADRDEAGAARALAATLGLPGPQPGQNGAAYTASGPAGVLSVRAGCIMEYQAAAAPGGAAVVEAEALAAARDLLRRLGVPSAGVPVRVVRSPASHPGVDWQFEFIPQVNGIPVLGAPDVVTLTPAGRPVSVRATLALAQFLDTVPLKDVARAAESLTGMPVAGNGRITLTDVALVFGRPPDPEADGRLVAQPFYEFTGTTAEGWPYVGYVPAVAGAPAP